MKKILIIGAGAMGSAFSIPCAENNNDVTIIGSVLEADFISSIKSNKNLHPSLNVILPNNIKIEKFEKIIEMADTDLDLIVVAVSSAGIDWVGDEISKFYKDKLSSYELAINKYKKELMRLHMIMLQQLLLEINLNTDYFILKMQD